MSEWKKAREAAAHAICEFIRSDCLKCPFNNDPAHAITRGCQAVASQAANAALSAFEREGFVLMPQLASYPMKIAAAAEDWPHPDIYGDFDSLKVQRYADDIYRAMITAALKDRT